MGSGPVSNACAGFGGTIPHSGLLCSGGEEGGETVVKI